MNQFEQLAEQIKVLGNPLRLQILQLLHRDGEQSVTDIYEKLQTAQPLISHNLDKMTYRQLLIRRRAGRAAYYQLNDQSGLVKAVLTLIPSE